ncbi:MAG TPA: BlaI/MecI/CopY family transcriptional regulator [Phycisphaerae bacterium]|nr:BlaI/MecI/CopY family transcriptional regulator [Phycisphaerae bacterium]
MLRRGSPHPTASELEILSVLWHKGPSTVRQVHETLLADRQTALTTTLKILQVMTEKGLVVRTQTRPHQFTAATPQEKTQAGLLNDLVSRAFDGSVHQLLLRAVERGNLSAEELEEVRKLIDNLRNDRKGGR